MASPHLAAEELWQVNGNGCGQIWGTRRSHSSKKRLSGPPVFPLKQKTLEWGTRLGRKIAARHARSLGPEGPRDDAKEGGTVNTPREGTAPGEGARATLAAA